MDSGGMTAAENRALNAAHSQSMNESLKAAHKRIAELEAENKTLRGDLEITELRLAAAWRDLK